MDPIVCNVLYTVFLSKLLMNFSSKVEAHEEKHGYVTTANTTCLFKVSLIQPFQIDPQTL